MTDGFPAQMDPKNLACFEQEVQKYDYLQLVIPDQYGIPRGKIVRGKFKKKFAKDGFEICNVVSALGPNMDLSYNALNYLGSHFPNEEMRPCLETLTPWPWASGEGRRVGNVLCDLYTFDGISDLACPRQLMKAQLEALWDRHKLLIMSAFEYEFEVFKEGTLEPLGGEKLWGYNIRIWNKYHDLFCDLTDCLENMGIELNSLNPEFAPGQWEITTEPQVGVRGGDVAFYVKNAVKGFFQTRGYTATFMSKCTPENMGTGLHLNHSLWTKAEGGSDGPVGRNAMLDPDDPDKMSDTARHWMAGLLAHAPALTALCSPTLNCYRRLFKLATPSLITWGVDYRSGICRVHNAKNNVYFENRITSGPCNPYLAIAGTVAAGLDGLNRKLELPPAEDTENAGSLPRSLDLALDALEQDKELRTLLGERFVQVYLISKREYEVQRYKNANLPTESAQLEFERNMYFESL